MAAEAVLTFRCTGTRYRSTTSNSEEGDVLEGLRPRPELESLYIEYFMGYKFPSWMMSRSLLLNNLKEIQLLKCHRYEEVPPLGHLPNLTELKINGMANLRCVGAEFHGYDLVHNVATTSEEIITLFPTLKKLYILECKNLIEWMEAPMVSTQKVVIFPCPEMLTINECSRLRNVPNVFSCCGFLERLFIRKCHSLGLIPITQRMTSLRKLYINCERLSSPLSVTASLVDLDVHKCNNLTSIEIKGGEVSVTTSPQNLRISFCDELSSLHLHSTSLRKLEIQNCPRLASFGVQSSSMTSLRYLTIENCERLQSLVTGLQFPLSLEEFVINGFSGLEILPSLNRLTSLTDLTVLNWRKLKYLKTELQWPTRLENLEIGGFYEELESFPDFQVGPLMHLTSLQLRGWPKLKSLPQQIQHLTSLTSLGLSEIDGVETLPEWLGSLTSLTELDIEGCRNLKNLPSVQAMQRLTNLQLLFISGCHPLLDQRCRDSGSPDWPKISHIENILIRAVGSR